MNRALSGLALTAAVTIVYAASAAARVPAPSVATGAAKQVTFQSALLTGSVNPRGAPTTYYFQYGPTAAYGLQSQPVALGSAANRSFGVSAAIGGLRAVTRYHYRVVAVNSTGASVGADRTFTTAKIPLSLAIAAVPNPAIFGGPVTIEGTLSGTGNAGRQVVLQQNAFPYTAGFATLGNAELTNAAGAFSFGVLSVTLNTQYRVLSTGRPIVVSPIVSEGVALRISMHAKRLRGRRVRFSGFINPSEIGARVGIQKLARSRWVIVSGTSALPAGPTASRYSRIIHPRRGGFFRAIVLPVEGAHVPNASTPVLVRLRR
jgi:hypothetical protein